MRKQLKVGRRRVLQSPLNFPAQLLKGSLLLDPRPSPRRTPPALFVCSSWVMALL